MNDTKILISLNECGIFVGDRRLVQDFSWSMAAGQVWLVTGPSGGGKEHFIQALANGTASRKLPCFRPAADSNQFATSRTTAACSNRFSTSTRLVSLETAAALIQEERDNDDGDYIEGGIDTGRTAARLLLEAAPEALDAGSLRELPEVALCGIESVLNRGVKYLSTGEVRRVLLCCGLLSRCRLLILSEPFAGLDVNSRRRLMEFFSRRMQSVHVAANVDNVATVQPDDATSPDNAPQHLILCMERFHEIPDGITHVLEFSGGSVSFQGGVQDYENLLARRREGEGKRWQERLRQADDTFQELHARQSLLSDSAAILVDMKDVRVAWGDKVVLNRLTWQVRSGEHWLIRGPNGSGKTTLLELITGDNMQVFCNDVTIFGRRRGTGETIWELKEKMGIVSYRLHLEYRMVGGTDIEAVLLSGFHDSIGLYQQRSQVEQMAVERWLEIGGFAGLGGEAFNSLSYGEQRAVLILRAAVKCPPLLILDEPCHGLDEEQRSLVLHLLEKIAATGTTTLLHVTHDPTEVLPCERHILELLPRTSPADDEKECYNLIQLD